MNYAYKMAMSLYRALLDPQAVLVMTHVDRVVTNLICE